MTVVFVYSDDKASNFPNSMVSYSVVTETSALGDAPLYNDVMLPSTGVLSPLSPLAEPPCATLPRLDDFPFPPSSAPVSSGPSQVVEDLELEMLAPYISMDNDYQLHTHADGPENLDSVKKNTRTHTDRSNTPHMYVLVRFTPQHHPDLLLRISVTPCCCFFFYIRSRELQDKARFFVSQPSQKRTSDTISLSCAAGLVRMWNPLRIYTVVLCYSCVCSRL